MRKVKPLAVIVVGLVAGLIVTPAFAAGMTGGEIAREIVGHRIYLAAPMSGEFPMFYRKDGTVTGDGRALGLGRFFAPTETGHWWIEGDTLCQQFKTWYNGSRICFVLERTGAGAVKWTRDNGETGLARIAD